MHKDSPSDLSTRSRFGIHWPSNLGSPIDVAGADNIDDNKDLTEGEGIEEISKDSSGADGLRKQLIDHMGNDTMMTIQG